MALEDVSAHLFLEKKPNQPNKRPPPLEHKKHKRHKKTPRIHHTEVTTPHKRERRVRTLYQHQRQDKRQRQIQIQIQIQKYQIRQANYGVGS